MTRMNDEQIDSVDAALLVGDSFKELTVDDLFIIRAALNRLYTDFYDRKSRSNDELYCKRCNKAMKDITELEDELRVLEKQLRTC